MGFRWTISLVLLYFLVFLSSVLIFSFTFAIGTWCIVFLLVIFLFEVFLSISSHFPSIGFYLFIGAQEFWAMGLTFLSYLRDDAADVNIGTLLVPWFRRWRYIACSC